MGVIRRNRGRWWQWYKDEKGFLTLMCWAKAQFSAKSIVPELKHGISGEK